MPTTLHTVLAALLALALVGVILVLLWFELIHPGRKARQLAADLGRRMGLTPVSAAEFTREFGFGPGGSLGMACAAGPWNGLRAGILLQAARSKYVGPYTYAIVAWPDPRAATLSLSRARSNFWSTPTPLAGPMAAAFTADGPAPEIQRVFNLQVQAMLAGFPRQLHSVACDKSVAWLMWLPAESDPSVCDHALRLAAEIARVRTR